MDDLYVLAVLWSERKLSGISHRLSAYFFNKSRKQIKDASCRQHDSAQEPTKFIIRDIIEKFRFLFLAQMVKSLRLCKPNSSHTVALKLFAFCFTLLKRTTYNLQLKRPLSFSLSALSFTLIILLFHVRFATARQPRDVGAAPGVALSDSITPLQIGDTIPEALWNLPLQMVKAGQEGSTTVKLKDYKGKLIILDFWATWCSNCLAAFPHIRELEHTFPEIVVLPVTYEAADKIQDFFRRTSSSYLKDIRHNFKTVVNQSMANYFPRKFIPHTVLLYNDKVIAITEPNQLNNDNIRSVLSGEDRASIINKVERDIAEPLLKLNFKNTDHKRSPLYSAVTGYLEGVIGAKVSIDTLKGIGRCYYTNMPVLSLYSVTELFADLALRSPNRRILEARHPERYTYYSDSLGLNTATDLEWLRENAYSYEVFFPATCDMQTVRKKMKLDLDFFFDIQANIEQREMEVWVLRRAESKGASQNLNQATLQQLEKTVPFKKLHQKKSADILTFIDKQGLFMPILDETYDEQAIDIELPIAAQDINIYRQALLAQGFVLEKAKRKIAMFVLRENAYQAAGQELLLTPCGYIPKR